MTWKDDFIAKYGEDAYAGKLAYKREWRRIHPDEEKRNVQNWQQAHPDKIKKQRQKHSRKTGEYYAKKQIYMMTGLQGERNKIRYKDQKRWRQFKQRIAPGSILHHQWIPKMSKYTGVALVEKDRHMHGLVDVIEILEGEITLFTEKEIREQKI